MLVLFLTIPKATLLRSLLFNSLAVEANRELQAGEAIDCIDVRERKKVRSAALARSKHIH